MQCHIHKLSDPFLHQSWNSITLFLEIFSLSLQMKSPFWLIIWGKLCLGTFCTSKTFDLAEYGCRRVGFLEFYLIFCHLSSITNSKTMNLRTPGTLIFKIYQHWVSPAHYIRPASPDSGQPLHTPACWSGPAASHSALSPSSPSLSPSAPWTRHCWESYHSIVLTHCIRVSWL